MTDKLKIVHIEDNDIVAKLVEEMVSSDSGISCEIEYFPLLKPALKRLAKGGFDIILTDLQLPDSDGINTFRQVHAEAPETPIVIMTGTYEEEELAVQALKEGAQDYLRKSEVNPDSLVRAIRYSIERQHAKNELKKAYSDLVIAQERLVQSEKLAGLARFSEGIAHEVRNPLGIIIGGAELLEKKLSHADEEVRTFVAMIKNAAVRASDILKSFLVYAKTRSKTAEKTDLNRIMRGIYDSIKQKNPSPGITIKAEIAKEEMYVEVDKDQIDEAIRNVINNALEAIPERGMIAIKAYKSVMPEPLAKEPAYVIEIDDTGTGISSEDMSKLFEPFFTTKIRTIGTGRGLFIANTIVESFDGKITIDSVQGKGTNVKISLPCRK